MRCGLASTLCGGPSAWIRPPSKHQHPPAMLDDEIQIVRGDDLTARKLAQIRQQPPPGPRVEIARRLIEGQNRRPAGEQSRQTYPLAFAHAQPHRATLLKPGKAHGVQAFRNPPADFLGRQSQIQRTEGDILGHRGAEQLIVRILKQKRHVPPNARQTARATTERR